MHVTCILGSPVREGNTDTMVRALLAGMKEKADKTMDWLVLNDLVFRGCQACNECKETSVSPCVEEDDMQVVHESLRKADLLVVASPLYMDGVTASVKAFIDRLNAFFGADWSPRLPGLKTVLLYSQGLEDQDAYEEVFRLTEQVYGKFGLQIVSRVVLENAGEHDAAAKRVALLEKLEALGRELARES